ncbi:unnamed protein product [Coccothraustes coccothraustes]
MRADKHKISPGPAAARAVEVAADMVTFAEAGIAALPGTAAAPPPAFPGQQSPGGSGTPPGHPELQEPPPEPPRPRLAPSHGFGTARFAADGSELQISSEKV